MVIVICFNPGLNSTKESITLESDGFAIIGRNTFITLKRALFDYNHYLHLQALKGYGDFQKEEK